MAARNKRKNQLAKPALDQHVIGLGKGEDAHWQEAEDQQSPALGDFQLSEELRLHEFGEFKDYSADDGLSQSAQEPTIPAFNASNDASFLDKEVDSQLLALLQRLTDRRLLLAGLLCSLILHLIAGGVLVNLEPEEHVINPPMQIQVRLLPENPLLESLEDGEETLEELSEEEIEETLAEVEVEEVVESTEEESIEELEPVIEDEIPAEAIAETELESEVAEEAELAETIQPPPLPSLDIIRSVIEQDTSSRDIEERSWASTCTNLQRQTGAMGCVTREEPEYAYIEQSPEAKAIYDFHNPVVERSRTDRTISTLSANTGLLASNLANVDIPEGLGEYLMSELETTITLYSDANNRVQDNMNRMVDKSDAALIARSLFDPSVRQMMQERQQRRIHSRQDLQRMSECGSPKIFVLAITEMKKFIDCTTRENNFLFRLAPLLL